MADQHVIAYMGIEPAAGHMHDRTILDVGPLTHLDPAHVAAQNAVEPDRTAGTDAHLADHVSARRDEHVIGNLWHVRTKWVNRHAAASYTMWRFSGLPSATRG